MLIAARESFAVHSRGTPTAENYVSDGLVALWDGIENAGYGVHNPTATAWKNLVGANGGDFVVTAGHFLDNALAVTGTNRTRTVGMPSSPTNTLTVDVAFTIPNVVRTAGTMFSWRVETSGPFVTSTAWSYFRITGGGNGTYGNDNNSYNLVPYVGTTYQATMTTFVGQNGLYVGGVLARSAFVARASFNAKYQSLIDAGGQGEIRYHSVRVYNRFLSASEIASNATIDKERFNLP